MGKADPRAEPARRMYEEEGRKLIDIAHELDIPPGTVRRWKSTYGWIDPNNKRSDKVSERSIKDSERSEKVKLTKKEVEQVMSNEELTDKQRLFCLHYIHSFNATKAYKKAYDSSYAVANAEGWKLLVNPRVRDEITRLKQNRLNRELLDESDIMQKYIDIAFSDINDYVSIGPDIVRCKADIDGTIISEISNTANGVKIKLADRMKALEWLAQHMDLLTAEQAARVAVLRKQVENNVDESETGVVELAPILDGGGEDG